MRQSAFTGEDTAYKDMETSIPGTVLSQLELDEDIIAIVDTVDPWDGRVSGAVGTPTLSYRAYKGREIPSSGKKKYKPVGEKKNPIAMEQPMDAEENTLPELEDWLSRMRLRDANHEIRPTINEETINDLDLPKDWSSHEMDYLYAMLFRCSKAFAWTEKEKGRIDPRIVPPIKIHVVENEGFKFPAPRYNARATEEIVAVLKEKIRNGELERCNGAYAGKWFIIRKPNGKARWISDFQDLNAITIRDVGSVPVPEAFTESLCSRMIYSLLDAMGGYDQTYLNRRSRDYTGILTQFGHLRWTILPQGWTNSVARFQDSMYRVYGDFIPHILDPYLDDLPIKGARVEDNNTDITGVRNFIRDHVDDLEKVLSRAIEVGMTFSAKKSMCGFQKMQVLSIIVGRDGKEMSAKHRNTILDWPVPRTSFECNSFVGLCKFVRIFIEKFADICRPLTRFITKDVPFEWGEKEQAAFDTLKKRVGEAPILTVPDYKAAETDANRKLIVCVDAGPELWGAVMKQNDAEYKMRPCRFESRSFSKGEQDKSQSLRELKAAVNAVKL